MNLDLKLIGGDFFYNDYPKEKQYLKHYFKTESQIVFLNYYMMFDEIYAKTSFDVFFKNIKDHTGYAFKKRWTQILIKKFKELEEELKKAYDESDLEKISKIKSGQFKLC